MTGPGSDAVDRPSKVRPGDGWFSGRPAGRYSGFGPSPLLAELACRRGATERMEREATRARTAEQTRPAGQAVGAVAEQVLLAAERSGELSGASLRSYRAALTNLRRTSLSSMSITTVRGEHLVQALIFIAAAAVKSGKASDQGWGAARTVRTLLNRVFRHAVLQGLGSEVTGTPLPSHRSVGDGPA